ncbi:hypothetical protein [Blastococcus sp. Marseille-P5729]|uniref:hypothetical protein n=1 Tax=Blastococcus sp. Marseille-P5729 TaxID=2086582 RepID=UPI000D1134F9|nr:hypothetical protein [Blastococcus sp. Marseille-P5729]
MRFGKSAIAATIAAVTAFGAGCNETTGGAGSPSPDSSSSSGPGSSSEAGPSTSGQQGDPVGKLVFNETEGSSNGDAVRAYAESSPDPMLLRSAEELTAWRSGLPGELGDDASVVSAPSLMDDAVAVAASYPKCMETSAVMAHDGGKISFEVWVPEEHKNTACSWSPVELELWIVELDELGADSPEDVELVD